uniref:Uncharacterized protein n=1 Tax=Timema cristinae TaxID=61476 RepID=A0A7R9CVI3_TIMCR|nr:unnamed protein product [Timema cristinae]
MMEYSFHYRLEEEWLNLGEVQGVRSDPFHYRLEEEWLNLGEVQGVRFPVPAEAFIPVKSRSGESYGWSTVAVQSYDKDTREYTVLPLDDSDTTRQLPRIYVMFKAEDPRNFAARIKDALDRRREAENLIRCALL